MPIPLCCIHCGNKKRFDSAKALNAHQKVCTGGQGNKETRRSQHVLRASSKRASEPWPSVQRKRARSHGQDLQDSTDEDEDDRGEGPSRSQVDSQRYDEREGQSFQDIQPPSQGEPSTSTIPVRSVRSGRAIRIPRRLNDYVPHGDMSLTHVPHHPTPSDEESPPPPTPPPWTITKPNKMGVFRRYPRIPSWRPESGQSLDSICDTSSLVAPPPAPITPNAIHELDLDSEPLPYEPFSSRTAAILMESYFSGSEKKSGAHLNSLARAMFSDPEFDLDELENFRTEREHAQLDAFLQNGGIDHPFRKQDGWHEASVTISLPVKGRHFTSESEAPQIKVDGLYYRRLIDIIKNVFCDKVSKRFHFTPFKQYWIPDIDNPEQDTERLYSEIYNSDIVLEYQESIDTLPCQEGDDLERVIIPLMLASDSAHLTSFGSASVWPIYVGFGNQTKYDRAKPSAHATHHLAYVPSLGPDFAHRSAELMDGPLSQPLETHCKREMMHRVWETLLDDEFMEAYNDGLELQCQDGLSRRFFPRIVSYSADYPEKVLLSSIRTLAKSPCPRCLIKKDDISEVGTPADLERRQHLRVDDYHRRKKIDKARRLMFRKGLPITSIRIEKLLAEESLVPTRNAFSNKLASTGFRLYEIFVVDQLHEIELGVWKLVLSHLIRILYTLPNKTTIVTEFDTRFRNIPTFGRDTIRKFNNNVSLMKQLAARDYEDILQASAHHTTQEKPTLMAIPCAIPAFDGFLPDEDNEIVLDLLFLMATFHAYAKLRLHTESTVQSFEVVTIALCQSLRQFSTETCSRYQTKELPREVVARVRREAATGSENSAPSTLRHGNQSSTSKRKEFNMNTTKIHSLPDYASHVRRFGTTDSYSTQTSELAHRLSKMWYAQSNKNKGFVAQVANKENRARFYQDLKKRLDLSRKDRLQVFDPEPTVRRQSTVPANDNPQNTGDDEPTNPEAHYYIGTRASTRADLTSWLHDNPGDPAFKDFRRRLLDHILAQKQGLEWDGDDYGFTDLDRDQVIIEKNRIHFLSTARFNYTTYDARRLQDVVKPHSHPDVMVLSHEEETSMGMPHPYWYARVMRIFYVIARFRTLGSNAPSEPQRFDTLWVRWLGLDSFGSSGWAARRLHILGFLPSDDSSGPAFGFIDPTQVIRAVHLIPAFSHGTTQELLGRRRSIAHQHPELEDADYVAYYLGMFADRDHFMRQRGGGVGHLSTRHCNRALLDDQHGLLHDNVDISSLLQPSTPELDQHDSNSSSSSDTSDTHEVGNELEVPAEEKVDSDLGEADLEEDEIIVDTLEALLDDEAMFAATGFAAL